MHTCLQNEILSACLTIHAVLCVALNMHVSPTLRRTNPLSYKCLNICGPGVSTFYVSIITCWHLLLQQPIIHTGKRGGGGGGKGVNRHDILGYAFLFLEH